MEEGGYTHRQRGVAVDVEYKDKGVGSVAEVVQR